jgi:hypothetical protein
MAWETMRPLSHDHRDGGKPKVALVGTGEGHTPEIAIRLSEPALEALGAKIGDVICVQRGAGNDDGWLRLSKSAPGFRIRGNNKRARPWIGFAAWPECGREPRRAEVCEWAIECPHVIKLKLPAWARNYRFTEDPKARAEMQRTRERARAGAGG